jgi:hypothetical protein
VDQERMNYHDRDLLVALSDAEKIDRGRQMANAHRELADVSEQHKMVKQQQKAREAEIEARISGLATSVSIGQEMRKVRCYEVADLQNERVMVYREDTGQIVDQRPLKFDDRQTKIPGVEGGKAPDVASGPDAKVFPFPVGGDSVRAECGHVVPYDGNPAPKKCVPCEMASDDIPPKTLEVQDYADAEKTLAEEPGGDAPEADVGGEKGQSVEADGGDVEDPES